ncbi:MAG: hypothetical protein VW339_04955 [Quisquiliibacterium sp.]
MKERADCREGLTSPRYFVGVFTVESWREFKRHGARLMGFNEKKASAAARLRPGDRILCYLSKVSAFVGFMEVTGASQYDTTPIWSDGLYPVRLPVQLVAEVALLNAIPIRLLSERLSFMRGLNGGAGWTIYVRSSPRSWSVPDGEAVVSELLARHAASPAEQDSLTEVATTALVASQSRQIRFQENTRVGRVISKTEKLTSLAQPEVIGSYDTALSFNKVTGYSVNVPIAATCRPTAVCLKTCYFATGAPSWSNALRHQTKVLNSLKSDPLAFAERVAMEYDQLGLSFLRWNGGGDLFEESVAAINYLGRKRPDIVLWVVTRIPEWAATIEDLPNVFIHFSLDKSSLARQKQFLRIVPRSRQYFFSYQCEPGEVPSIKQLEHVSVLFFDNYDPTCDLRQFRAEIICPLNERTQISGTCEQCRRCFDGTAVRDRTTLKSLAIPMPV